MADGAQNAKVADPKWWRKAVAPTLVGVVLTIAATAGFGMIEFILGRWGAFPKFLQIGWVVIVIAFVGASVWSLIVDAKLRSTPPPSAQEQQINILKRQGFEELFRTEDVASGTVAVMTKGPDFTDGVTVYDAARVHENGLTQFKVAILADNKIWKSGSHRQFVENTEGQTIEDSLRDDFYRRHTEGSIDTICIGLASAEPFTGYSNEQLANDRAINLCRALINLGYINASVQSYIAVSYGAARPAPAEEAINLERQRSAILVSVKQYYDDDPSQILATVSKLLDKKPPAGGVRLRDFDRFPEGNKYWHFGGGDLVGYGDPDDWNQEADPAERFARLRDPKGRPNQSEN